MYERAGCLYYMIFAWIHLVLLGVICTVNGIRLTTMSSSSSLASSVERFVNTGPTVLRATDLSKRYAETPQFDQISLTLGKGQRVGLIGVNGAGKSTLLKCLAKLDTPDSGTVEVTNRNCNVVYVDQEPDWKDIPVYEALFEGVSDQAKANRLYFNSLDPSKSDEDGSKFAKASDAMEASQAWDYQTQGLAISERLNIKNDMLYRDISSLSGGEKKRVGLAAALLKQPDGLSYAMPICIHFFVGCLHFLFKQLSYTNIQLLCVPHFMIKYYYYMNSASSRRTYKPLRYRCFGVVIGISKTWGWSRKG